MDDISMLLYLLQVWICLIKLKKLNKTRKSIIKRRWWVKPHIHRHIRNILGGYRLCVQYFKFNDEEEFKRLIGLSIEMYDCLFSLVGKRLQRHSIRQPLEPGLKLAIVLSFLHHGGNVQFFTKFYRIGLSTMFAIIKQVCAVIKDALMPLYIPKINKNSWLKIAHDYEQLWQMPNCLGALDGKHFALKRPPHSGSLFYNYRNFFSTVLLATCDAYNRFTWFNLGDFGSVNDASIFNNSDLNQKLQNGELNIPRPCKLPRSNITMPYFFIGDDIFALQKHLMKPYPRKNHLTRVEKIYNYRLKRARLIIECAFGMLTSRWAILQKKHAFHLETFEEVIIATLCLHNMVITFDLKQCEKDKYNLIDEEEQVEENEEGENIISIIRQRDLLAQYFISKEGSVARQDEYI